MKIAILLAAGKSSRAKQNKLWFEFRGKPLWKHAHDTLLKQVEELVLVVPKGEEARFAKHSEAQIVPGGDTRMESFKAGLAALQLQDEDIIIDHNAANPFVTEKEIQAVIEAAQNHGAAALYQPAVDTVFSEDGPLDRSKVKLMQTPQAVRGDILKSIELGEATDLSTALFGQTTIEFVQAHPLNRKLTFGEELQALEKQTSLGEDSHRFGHEGQLTLGGLRVPDCPAMEANSDGDVILHALGRALAQAQGLSFSEHADALCESGETNSRVYLKKLLIDITLHKVTVSIEGKRPKIDELPLKESLAKILNMNTEQIQISAHTGEELTAFGRGEGLRCLCLIEYS